MHNTIGLFETAIFSLPPHYDLFLVPLPPRSLTEASRLAFPLYYDITVVDGHEDL